MPTISFSLKKYIFPSQGSHNHASRAATPTPYEIQPIYEAESPDELALVDAACAYSCRLLRRTPGAVVVSLPGKTYFITNVL